MARSSALRSIGILVALGAAVLAVPSAVVAQCRDGAFELVVPPGGVTQEITLEGRARYQGRVVEVGESVVRFQLLSGDVLEVDRARIRCLREVAGYDRDGEFWPADPNTTRLFFGPTGRALPRGAGYLSVFEIIFPLVAYGVSDRFTLAGGLPLIFGRGAPELFWLAPKLEVVRTPGLRGSVGVLAFLGGGDSGSVGILYAVGTAGHTTDNAVTFGAGWGYESDSGIHGSPAFMLGLESRLSRRIKLISENYLITSDSFGALSLGPRFIGENLSADLGLAVPVGRGASFFTFPLVNFVYNF